MSDDHTPVSEHEAAYAVYVGPANRSLLLTAELTHTPIGTIKWYASTHRWKDRADREAQQLRALMDIHTRRELTNEMPGNLKRLRELRASDNELVALKATESLIRWYGPPFPDAAPPTDQDTDIDHPDYDAMTTAELVALVQQERRRRSG